jgi:hypothetical protein
MKPTMFRDLPICRTHLPILTDVSSNTAHSIEAVDEEAVIPIVPFKSLPLILQDVISDSRPSAEFSFSDLESNLLSL